MSSSSAFHPAREIPDTAGYPKLPQQEEEDTQGRTWAEVARDVVRDPVKIAEELWLAVESYRSVLAKTAQSLTESKAKNNELEKEIQQLKADAEEQKILLNDYRVINKQLKEQASKKKAPTPIIQSTETDTRRSKTRHESRQDTPGSNTSVNKVKRSAKFPDPPVLDDGQDPTFQIWVSQMRNKLIENADWFKNDD